MSSLLLHHPHFFAALKAAPPKYKMAKLSQLSIPQLMPGVSDPS